jgi:hypothetical protein
MKFDFPFKGSLFVIILFFNYLFSDPPSWTVIPNNYEFNASMTGVLIFNEVESIDGTDIIAAFVGDECRGVKTDGSIFPPNGNLVFGMTLYGNSSGDLISFKAYDVSIDHIFDSTYFTYSFIPNDIVGSADNPVEWSFTDQNLNINNESLPDEFILHPAHPNPFNPVTTIRFSIPNVETLHAVSLRIYDIQGKLVETLVDGELSSGNHSVKWDADGVSSGVYFVLLEGSGQREIQKVVLMK